jgi:type 1 glutamine amidotransferase
MPNLLYVTHSAGYKHEVLPYSHEVMERLGRETGAFTATVTDDVSCVNWKNLARDFDVVAFCTTGELPLSDDAKNALIDFVRREGKAFVGIHNATDTFYKYAPYGEMVGGYFNGHPWHQEVNILVEDPDHPSTQHLPDEFRIHDEIYTHRNWSRDKTHVLLTLDLTSVDPARAPTRSPSIKARCRWPGATPSARAACSTPRSATACRPGAANCFISTSSAASAGPTRPVARRCRCHDRPRPRPRRAL